MKHVWILALALTAAACDKKAEESPATPADENTQAANAPTPADANTNVAAATPTPTVDVESLPVQEQFEQEAEKELTPQNLVAKLDELEKEIGSP